MATATIHRWTTPGEGSVNTWWLETERGVVVIDGQRELSKARAAKAAIDATGKPIEAVFLTHPHPDHFGGIGVFAPPGSGIPIYGSRATRDSIAADRFGLVKKSRDLLGDDFPDQPSLPELLVSDGDAIEIAGVRLVAREWGEGEAECMTILHLAEQAAVFAADVIQHDMTAFLLEGRSAAWLRQLDRLARDCPAGTTLYPGHGAPGDAAALIAAQRDYLETFRRTVLRHAANGGAGTARVVAAMEERYPGFLPVAAIPDLLAQNVEPVAKELERP